MVKKKKDAHYLKNTDLLAEIVACKKTGVLSNKAANMFILLANKTIKKMRYSNPDDRDDCYQTGIMQMLLNWHHFDETKSTNSFSYFTEIFKRGIAKGYGELFYHKGDKERTTRTISLSSGNDGESLFNL
ncbi:hypothetical protein [Hymenobacter sp. APR13]|uniref:hypothetical protein n=1 Tax=Hymenobacter sp. APR13 TaxID=1356852 RepID=UPI0004E03FEB|nr:hypothetical protein [Hymenobacter sp. APR13]AII50387.1 hypothetical protein N008_00105 [Hymenobacter sp. APR13]